MIIGPDVPERVQIYAKAKLDDITIKLEKLYLDSLVGLYICEDNPDGSRKSGKIWEWK